ncbi:MAG: hypothetical protein KKB13_10590 [Chloroflexi bacterium]|nr:hypothetical protein [Chloroflexota bacterium]
MAELRIRVNDDLVLDAGRVAEHAEGGQIWRIVHPPRQTMFEQILAYLERQPAVTDWPGIHLGEEAIAAVAVTLRWGSYLAVLLDSGKPRWAAAQREDIGRISDAEMARMNIEASAALAGWLAIMRADYHHYLQLMWTAHRHLPMPRKTVRRDKAYGMLLHLADPEYGQQVAAAGLGARHDHGQSLRAAAEAQPLRLLANALIHTCWRNGPVESIHAGALAVLPLGQRRLAPLEERLLVRTTAERLASGLWGASTLAMEQSARTWPERVLPYGLPPVAPTGWTLTESTRALRLYGAEPT